MPFKWGIHNSRKDAHCIKRLYITLGHKVYLQVISGALCMLPGLCFGSMMAYIAQVNAFFYSKGLRIHMRHFSRTRFFWRKKDLDPGFFSWSDKVLVWPTRPILVDYWDHIGIKFIRLDVDLGFIDSRIRIL